MKKKKFLLVRHAIKINLLNLKKEMYHPPFPSGYVYKYLHQASAVLQHVFELTSELVSECIEKVFEWFSQALVFVVRWVLIVAFLVPFLLPFYLARKMMKFWWDITGVEFEKPKPVQATATIWDVNRYPNHTIVEKATVVNKND